MVLLDIDKEGIEIRREYVYLIKGYRDNLSILNHRLIKLQRELRLNLDTKRLEELLLAIELLEVEVRRNSYPSNTILEDNILSKHMSDNPKLFLLGVSKELIDYLEVVLDEQRRVIIRLRGF